MNKTVVIVIIVIVLLLCCCAVLGTGAFFFFTYDWDGNGDKDKTTTDKQEIDLASMIEKLCRLRGIDIELCGVWLWVSGDTYSVKDHIKGFGFKFSSKKKNWYWFEGINEQREKKYFGRRTMKQIRNKYGSEKFESIKKDTEVTA